MIKESLIIESIQPHLTYALSEYQTLFNSRKWTDFKEFLPAFASHLNFNLIVKQPAHAPEKNLIGQANGKDIIVYQEWGYATFYFSYFHEMAHNLMHFKDGDVVSKTPEVIEVEADLFAFMMCRMIFPEAEDTFQKIAKNNPVWNPGKKKRGKDRAANR